MSELALVVMLFFSLLVLVASLGYLWVHSAESRQALQRRLQMIQTGEPLPAEQQEKEKERLEQAEWLLQILPASDRLRLFVMQAGVDRPPSFFVVASLLAAVVGLLVAFVTTPPLLLAVTMVVLAGAVPFTYLAVRRQRRLSRFEQQFPDALDVLSRAVRAGYAFSTGLKVVADEMPSPVSDEFRKTFEQQNLGLPLRDALFSLSERVPLADVRIFVSTLQIQSETGGNLAEVLDKLSAVVRDRFRLLRQVRVYTAEGRLSLYILTALPPIVAVLFYLTNPGYIMRLFTDEMGRQMLAAAVVLQIIGFLVIRKIVNIRV